MNENIVTKGTYNGKEVSLLQVKNGQVLIMFQGDSGKLQTKWTDAQLVKIKK